MRDMVLWNLSDFTTVHQRMLVRWRTRLGGFFTDIDGTLLLVDQWRQDDGPVEKVEGGRLPP